MNKVLTTIGRASGALLPVLLVISVSIDLYDRYRQHHQNKQKSTPTPTIDSKEEPATDNE